MAKLKKRQTVLALDPGTKESGWVIVDQKTKELLKSGISLNSDVVKMIDQTCCKHIAIEMIASYGMPVGREVFETCVWIGRFIQAANITPDIVYRKDVKIHLCQTQRAKDKNITQAIKDLYPATGGGKNPVVGTMKQPGPLYGVKSHIWAALGVAITYIDNIHQFTDKQCNKSSCFVY